MCLLYGIAFSGGYDSSYFLKNICIKKQSQKYVLINVFKPSETKYSNTHFKIAQAAYELNIAFKIIKTKKSNNSKNKHRITRLNAIYKYLKHKKIGKLYVLLSHTDVVETFVMRVLKHTNTQGLCTIYNSSNVVFYKCFRIFIFYPQIEITRQQIINNTHRLCADYSNKPDSNKRNIIRTKINIAKYYYNVINFILFLKALNTINKYEYCVQTQILKTIIQDNCCLNNNDIQNIILKGTKILYFQTNNTVKKSKIQVFNNKNVNKCYVNIVNKCFFIKLSYNFISVERKNCKTILLINNIHKIEIYHSKTVLVNYKKYYTKAKYKNIDKCFQQNIKLSIVYNKIVQNVKINDFFINNNFDICGNYQIFIRQVVVQKNFYK